MEAELLTRHELVGGMDEVGRGSLAGPVTVGLAVVSRDTPDVFPAALADSKQLTARRREALVEHLPGAIILDGTADWLTEPDPGLLDALTDADDPVADGAPALPSRLTPPVRTEVKGDARCAVVAAASVLAKVERDALMADLPDPGYGWAANKGYASAAHIEGLARLGTSDQHRRSWRLPGLDASDRAARRARDRTATGASPPHDRPVAG